MKSEVFLKDAIRQSRESRRIVQVNVSSHDEAVVTIQHLEATRPNVGHVGTGAGTEVWGYDEDATWPDETWRLLLVVVRPLD